MNMNKMNDLLMSRIESAAQMTLGQAVLRMIDRILWIVEKSVQWSLPSQDVSSEENGKTFGKIELVRPLPWVIFLPALLFLRIVRVGLGAAGALFGYPQIEPSDMVRAIQRGRRRLKAIKNNGLKSMRLKNTAIVKDRALTMREASESLAKTIRLTLSTLSCLDSASKTSPSPPPTKIRVSNILDTAMSMSEESNAIDSAIGSPSNQDSKRKYSELSGDDSSTDDSDEEPLLSKIDRLANMSGSDKDFNIGDCSWAESSNTSTSDSEADVSIPLSEVEDIKSEYTNKLTECLTKLKRYNTEQCTNGSKAAEVLDTAVENVKHDFITNGVGSDRDTAFYSPISWKSVSPEVSIPSEKQENNNGDIEETPTEEFKDGQINNGQEKEDSSNADGKNAHGTSGESTIENVKDKQRNSPQSGGSGANKQQLKNKRGSHGNRKKK